MTGHDFTEWRQRMGFSKPAAARALGASRNMPHRYETGAADVPLYIALACTAVTLGLRPYADDPTEEPDEDLTPYGAYPAGDLNASVPPDSDDPPAEPDPAVTPDNDYLPY